MTTIDCHSFNLSSLQVIEFLSTLQNLLVRVFESCYKLERGTLPNLLQRIEQSSFSGCKALEEIIFPEELKEIGKYAFVGCSSLSGQSGILTIPNLVKIVGEEAFYNCKKLKHVRISKQLQVLHHYMFADYCNLERVNLPDALILIKYNVFSGCHRLYSVNCLDTLEEVKAAAFKCCTRLNILSDFIDFTYYHCNMNCGGRKFIITDSNNNTNNGEGNISYLSSLWPLILYWAINIVQYLTHLFHIQGDNNDNDSYNDNYGRDNDYVNDINDVDKTTLQYTPLVKIRWASVIYFLLTNGAAVGA